MYKKVYILRSIAGILCTFLFFSCGSTGETIVFPDYRVLSPFGASYEKITPGELSEYDLVIVEPSHYNRAEIKELQATGTKVIAYISLGEVNTSRWYFPIFEERGFLGKNANWDSYYINLADPFIYAFFFDEIIPEIMVRNFDGLFLDTVDAVAPYTERSHLQPHMASLIRQIRSAYPDATIIQNAGLFLLDSTSRAVDAVLVEDVATHYDFGSQTYKLKRETAYQQQVNRISELSVKHELPFLIIDFADSASLRTRAVQRLDSLSYPYFINTIGLNNISGGTTGNNY